jgi:predicted nucleotidyltransferase
MPYPHIALLLQELLEEIQNVLGQKLIGVYLYGSLVTGDFDPHISDIDLLAVITSRLTEEEFARLERMHLDFIAAHLRWENRLEIAYLTQDALQTFRTQTSEIAVISPGEPFHRKEAGKDWTINWYFVRKQGLTLFGPPPESIIPPIPTEQFLAAVKAQAIEWGDWVIHTKDPRKYQSYAILTICRALYACVHGEQVSKKQAAAWALEELPDWSALIQKALVWRAGPRVGGEATYPETEQFVQYVISQIVNI